ncbi:MAG: tyrosine-type recombinase/integrase [Acidimicrobiales bacterium]
MAQGHIKKRGKTWSFVHHIVDPATGRGRYRWKGGFRTKADAQRALREALSTVEAGSFVEPSRLTLGDFVSSTWVPQINFEIEESTAESYERNMRVHVLPHLGGLKLQKLSPQHLNEFYRILAGQSVKVEVGGQHHHQPAVYDRVRVLRESGATYQSIADQLVTEFPQNRPLTRHAVAAIVRRQHQGAENARKPLSITSIRYIHTIISRCLKDAVKLGLLTTNPASNATPPSASRSKPPRTLWSAEQTRTFFEWLRDADHRLWPAWAFVATSGHRRGANLGFRWQDIDLDTGTAACIWRVTCVRHQIRVKPYDKYGQNHQILLDHGTIELLKWWRARQNQERLALGTSHHCESVEPGCSVDGYHLRDIVFSRSDGDYLHPERFSREFTRAQSRYNKHNPDSQLPRITIHTLRHGWATVALEEQVPMKVVQDRLNHASEKITADIYTHVRPAMQSDAADRVARLILPDLLG